jgi:hypothetical protein
MSIKPEHVDKELLELIRGNIRHVKNQRGLYPHDTYSNRVNAMVSLHSRYGNRIRAGVNQILWNFGYFDLIKKALAATAGNRESGQQKHEPIPSQLPSEVRER